VLQLHVSATYQNTACTLYRVVVVVTTSVLDLGHGGHGHALNSSDGRSRRAYRAAFGRLDTEERVEECEAEFSTAGEVHEEIDGVVGVVEEGNQRVEQPPCRPLLRCYVRKCSVGVTKKIDIDWNAEDEKDDANDYQHYSR